MKRIIIRLGDQAPAKVDWAEIKAEGKIFTARNSLAEISARIRGHQVIALIPGTDVLLTQVVLPKTSWKRQVQAVPYIMEESLAADVENLHFALGGRLKDNTIAVAVIARELLDIWLSILTNVEIEPSFIVPDILAVPFTDIPAILFDGHMVLCHTGRQSGFSFELANLPELLASDSEQFAEIVSYGYRQKEDMPSEIQDKIVAEHSLHDEPMEILAAGFEEKNAINLLQGPYSPHAQWERLWYRWRFPAGLALTAVLLFAGLQTERYFTLRQKNAMLSKQIEQLYREVFPESQKIVNPRIQMGHRLQELQKKTGGSDDFLSLLKNTAAPMPPSEGFRLDSLHYHNGVLDLDIRLADLQALDNLTSRLSAQNFAVNIRTASSIEDEVQVQLQIGEESL
ncbi:MAG: type II secretion system protein GspL [Desulfobia sp.]